MFRVPIDRRITDVQQTTQKLGELASHILFLYGSNKTITSNARDPLPIYPASALQRLPQLSEEERFQTINADFDFDVLVGDASVNLLNVSADFDKGELRQFEILLGKNDVRAYALLQGFIDNNPETSSVQDENYVIEIFEDTKLQRDITYIDAESMSNILSSVIRKQKTTSEPDLTITGKVLQLIDASPVLYSNEVGSYDMTPQNGATSISVRIGRAARILSGVDSTTSYSIGTEEHFWPRTGVETVLGLTLNYDRNLKPSYSATLVGQVNDPDERMTDIDRETYLETLKDAYGLSDMTSESRASRRRAPLFFRTLGGIANRLAKYGPTN